MREPDHFTFFRDVILPESPAAIRKTGFSPSEARGAPVVRDLYALHLPERVFWAQAIQWDTRILATDISQQALSKAKAGQYKLPADMPGEWAQALFCKG